MKQLRYFSFLILLLIATASQAQISVGPGIVYGFDVEEIGLQARGVYSINETWRGQADFTYYLEDNDFISFWEFNTNANYIFVDNGNSIVYALAGLQFFHVKIEDVLFGGDVSDTDTGLNLGIGGQLGLSDKITGFGEAKFTVGGAEQLLIAAGVLIGL